MYHQLLSLSAGALALTSLVHANMVGMRVTPNEDGQCQTPVKHWTYTEEDGDTVLKKKPFTVGYGVSVESGAGGHAAYGNVDFTFGADNKDPGTSGSAVFWKVPQIDDNCRVIMMQPYESEKYGDVSSNPGLVIMNVKQAGCYYTQLSSKQSLYMTFCCGRGNCESYAMGYGSLSETDPVQGLHVGRRQEDANSLSSHKAARDSNEVNKYERSRVKRPATTLPQTARAAALTKGKRVLRKRAGSDCADDDADCAQKFFLSCNPTVADNWQTSGIQLAIGAEMKCEVGAPCSIATTTSISNATEVSTSQDVSVEHSDGTSTDITAGMSYPVTMTESIGFQEGMARTTTNTTGHSLTTTVQKDVAFNNGVLPGSLALLTFTPDYTCYNVDYDCGSGDTFSAQSCSVNTDGSGDPQGSYYLVAIG